MRRAEAAQCQLLRHPPLTRPVSVPTAAIVGVAGPELGAAERRLIEAQRPWGFILFARNCVRPAQVGG